MKITNNLAAWLAIPTTLALSLGGVAKSIDFVKHDFLGKPRNDEEVFVRHMASDHLLDKDSSQSTSIPVRDGIVIVNVFPDKCIVIKRKTNDGMITAMKVLPDPERVGKIKELYSDCDNNIAYAMAAPFDFGYHKQDVDYEERQQGKVIIRTYGDSCALSYEFDKYGNSKNWIWIKYRH